MKLLVLVLVLVTSCSSGSQRSACSPHPQPISSIHCADRPLELAELRTKEDELVGHVVTIAGPLGETRPWCIDCCPSLVELHPWSLNDSNLCEAL